MGNDCSKRPNRTNHRSPIKVSNPKSAMAPNNVGFGKTSDISDIQVESILQDDVRNIEVIKREFNDNVEVFLLNNIVMAVQFFVNYKDDRIKTVATTMRQLDDLGLGDDIMVESVQRDDLMIINVIKQELEEHAQVFVLNNMIMAVQFFSDHREIITRLQHVSSSPQEKEMNKTLLKDETMECTYPDVIMEEVNKNVIFRTVEEHSSSENLVAKRIYVINDLIEVVKSKEVPQYTSIDKPLYQVSIEECNRKGFVKLLQIENNTPILSSREFVENYDPLPGPSSRSDSEYDYLTITALRTPKPIEVDSTFERRDTLPGSCFSQRKVKKYPVEESDDSDDEEAKLEYLANLQEDDLYKEVTYINSYGIMRHFQNTLFPMSLGKSLGFNLDAIAMAKAIPGKIFCDDLDIETNIVRTCQVIPAVGIPWPDDETIEFVEREDRPTIFDRRTGIKYRWPTDGPGGMIEEIKKMSAVLVPKGYAKKRGVNKDANLEWEINFPKVERFLEARMSHAQMKCFLLLLTLHKTYIAPVTEQNGLLSEHLRTHMYWECERDYRNWPEHRLGTKILRVIKDLQHRLFLGSLPDYFIKDKNLFENIPKKYLQFAQKILLDIMNNPVPHFIKALRNLRYTSGKFYPPLNFTELYEGLRSKTSAELINPKLLGTQKPFLKRRIFKDPDQQIRYLKERKVKEKILTLRRKEKLEELSERVKEEISKRERNDIDLDAPIEKNLDLWKTKAILDMFIKNFIDIAKRSATLATKDQVLFYLKQAFYLTKILEQQSVSFLEDARDYREIISAEETRIKKITLRSPSTEEKPPTPVRNSVSFQYNDNTVTQQMKTGSIRLNNLHSSYMIGLQGLGAPAPMRNLKPATVQRSESYKQNGPAKRKTVAFVT